MEINESNNSVVETDSFKLFVLDEISKKQDFFKRNNLIRYVIPKPEEIIDNQVVAKRVIAVWDLANEGAFRINGDYEFFPDEFKYVFLLEVLRPEFNQLHKKYKSLEHSNKPALDDGKRDSTNFGISDKWNQETGLWIIKIPGQENKRIKLGKKGTETNETFFKLYHLKNKDISGQEIRSHLATVRGKNPKNVNVGGNASSVRKWIKAGLGDKFNLLVKLTHDRTTKTYKLETKF